MTTSNKNKKNILNRIVTASMPGITRNKHDQSREHSLPPVHPIIYCEIKLFKMAAVSVKRSVPIFSGKKPAGAARKPKRFRKVNNRGLVVAGEITIIVIKCSQIYKIYFFVGIMVMETFFSRKNETFEDLHYCNTNRNTVSVYTV